MALVAGAGKFLAGEVALAPMFWAGEGCPGPVAAAPVSGF